MPRSPLTRSLSLSCSRHNTLQPSYYVTIGLTRQGKGLAAISVGLYRSHAVGIIPRSPLTRSPSFSCSTQHASQPSSSVTLGPMQYERCFAAVFPCQYRCHAVGMMPRSPLTRSLSLSCSTHHASQPTPSVTLDPMQYERCFGAVFPCQHRCHAVGMMPRSPLTRSLSLSCSRHHASQPSHSVTFAPTQ